MNEGSNPFARQASKNLASPSMKSFAKPCRELLELTESSKAKDIYSPVREVVIMVVWRLRSVGA
jgi:hypothetical protein